MERFTIPKLEQRIAEIGRSVYRQRLDLTPVRWSDSWSEAALAPGFDDSIWESVRPPYLWGGRDVKATIRCRFQVPEAWRGRRVALRVDLSQGLDVSGPDATAYLGGEPRQGIDIYHKELLLDSDAVGKEQVLALEAYSGTRPEMHRFGGVELVEIDEEARGFYYDALVALESAKLLPETSYERVEIINALDESIRLLDFREPLGDDFRRSIGVARADLRERLYAREWPGERPEVVGVGHAHIDVAWLWTLLHTRKKTGRTFLTALRLMEQYPEYHFLQSQPQLYQYFQHDYPEQYPEVKRRVAEGRWEATGGMWLEADLNITGGESLVRQVLLGKRFFRREFGVDSELLWLPDVFGYTWALPQIMARSGIKYFMTTKISWSEFNQFPYDTFRWQGIDGTRVLAHFINTPSQSWFATYNGKLTPEEVKGTWDTYKQKRLNDRLLLAFGFGDGGGGPTADMLETARRLKDLPGMPRFEVGRADAYYQELESVREASPIWNGELYLEFHRGTYTSQAKSKLLNRRSEQAYHDAEALAAMDHLFGGNYPAERLNQGWELILLNQFHDILPGSSIGEVYAESVEQYQEVLGIADDIRREALSRLTNGIAAEAGSLTVFNTLDWRREGLVEVSAPEGWGPSPAVDWGEGTRPCQVVGEGADKRLLVPAEGIPAYGWRTGRLVEAKPASGSTVSASTEVMESPSLRVELDAAGRITSLFDKVARREVLAAGELGNEFVLFEDKPINNDAWNIDAFYQEKSWVLDQPAEIRVLEEGPIRAGVEVRRRFLNSTMTQRLYVYAGKPRIDFQTEVDWHERHLLLKVAFPVAVHSPRATYEIQFGNVERPTHWNSSWDYARFEVPAQRWADLSEGDYGVSLLNDCKYGYDIRDHLMRLTLIKSATSPDPEADQGEHVFTYSVYPHAGDWREDTIRQAADLNMPLMARMAAGQTNGLPSEWSLVTSSPGNLVVDTVKKAEDDARLIVRVYEAHGQRGTGRLAFGKPVQSAVECNLMEEEEGEVAFDERGLEFDFLPYQIRTFKVGFA